MGIIYQLCFPTVGRSDWTTEPPNRQHLLSTHKPRIGLLYVLWLHVCLSLRWPVAAKLFWNGHVGEYTWGTLFRTVVSSIVVLISASVTGSSST